MFDEDGVVMPKLIDFGIAKLLGDEGAAGHKTRTGTPMGTPYYMSPEQCRGKNLDHRTDIYSLGILIHVLLTGKKPFDGDSVMDILLKHITEAPPRLSFSLPNVPKALEEAVATFLEKDPDKRPQTAADALTALESAVRGLTPEQLRARGGDESARVSIVSGVGPHQSSADGAEAHTIVDPVRSDIGAPNATLEPAATDTQAALATTKPAGKKGIWVAVAVFAAAAAGAAVVLAMMGGKAPAGTVAAHAATSGADVGTAKTASPVVVPAGDVKSAAPNGAEGGEVEITLDTDPKSVDVYRGADKIGTSGAPLKLPRSKEPVTLTLKAQGRVTKQIDVSAEKSATVTAKLDSEPAAAGTPAKPGGGAVGPTGTTTGAATKTTGSVTTKPPPHKGDANDLSY